MVISEPSSGRKDFRINIIGGSVVELSPATQEAHVCFPANATLVFLVIFLPISLAESPKVINKVICPSIHLSNYSFINFKDRFFFFFFTFIASSLIKHPVPLIDSQTLE